MAEYICVLLENYFNDFKKYEKFLEHEVFNHEVKIEAGVGALVLVDRVNEKTYCIHNDFFFDKFKKGDQLDKVYHDYVVKSNLYLAKLFGHEYMEDSEDFFDYQLNEIKKEMAVEHGANDNWDYHTYAGKYAFYQTVKDDILKGFKELKDNNKDKQPELNL